MKLKDYDHVVIKNLSSRQIRAFCELAELNGYDSSEIKYPYNKQGRGVIAVKHGRACFGRFKSHYSSGKDLTKAFTNYLKRNGQFLFKEEPEVNKLTLKEGFKFIDKQGDTWFSCGGYYFCPKAQVSRENNDWNDDLTHKVNSDCSAVQIISPDDKVIAERNEEEEKLFDISFTLWNGETFCVSLTENDINDIKEKLLK